MTGAKPTDVLARFKQTAERERNRPEVIETSIRNGMPAEGRPGTVKGYDVEARGGRRSVFYLPDDVIAWLNQLQAVAAAEGGRLTKSGIITQLVRRYGIGGEGS